MHADSELDTFLKQTVNDRAHTTREDTPAQTFTAKASMTSLSVTAMQFINKRTHRESVRSCRVRDDGCARAVTQHHGG